MTYQRGKAPPRRPLGEPGHRARKRSAGSVQARAMVLSGVLGAIAAMSGCASLVPEAELGKARAEVVGRDVASALGKSQVPLTGHTVLQVETHRPYTGLRPIVPSAADDLPQRFLGEDGISIPLERGMTAAEMAQHITAATGLAVRFVGREPAGREGQAVPRFERAPSRILGASARWQGPLPELLDEWTQALGYEWRFDAERSVIEVVRAMSAVYQLHALGGVQEYTVGSSTSGGSSGSGETSTADFSQQTLGTQYQYDPWAEIEEAIKGLVSAETQVGVSPAQASVTVTGLPAEVRRVGRYLRHVNRTVLRPIEVTVRVFSVFRDSGADFATDFTAALRSIAGSSYDVAFESTTGTQSVGVVRPGAALAHNSLEVTLRALRTLGTVSRVLSAGVPALNGAPAQYYELVRHTYLAEVSTTFAEGGVATELRPGSISSGFAMSYVGRITGPGEVMLRIFASLQDPPTFEVFGNAANLIQLPEFRSRGISVTQRVREGETLVLSGFSDRVLSTDEEGFLKAANPFGGATLHADSRIDQVLLVTSRIGEAGDVTEVSEVAL